MTERNLALALMRAGRLTMGQVQSAAKMRTQEKNLARVLVELQWISQADILLFDPHAFETPPLLSAAPNAVTTNGAAKSGDSRVTAANGATLERFTRKRRGK